jgi:hypothetical protein
MVIKRHKKMKLKISLQRKAVRIRNKWKASSLLRSEKQPKTLSVKLKLTYKVPIISHYMTET